jgi:organic hydroperoxide reductase OsmC/OhrA
MIELVWDAERAGTATAPSGVSVTVGEDAHFAPDDLLAMSAASCLMRTFLRLAEEANLPILSYTATARTEFGCEDGDLPRVSIHTYLVAATNDEQRALQQLARRSVSLSPILQLLGDRAAVTSDVRVLYSAEATQP